MQIAAWASIATPVDTEKLEIENGKRISGHAKTVPELWRKMRVEVDTADFLGGGSDETPISYDCLVRDCGSWFQADQIS